VCFSVQADLVGGAALTAIAVDTLIHTRGRPDHRAFAALPLLFGLHQLDEALVWWQLQGHLPSAVGTVATWIYLLFAFVVLPTYVPFAVRALEPAGRRRDAMTAISWIGAAV
jgi:hypothetical protein